HSTETIIRNQTQNVKHLTMISSKEQQSNSAETRLFLQVETETTLPPPSSVKCQPLPSHSEASTTLQRASSHVSEYCPFRHRMDDLCSVSRELPGRRRCTCLTCIESCRPPNTGSVRQQSNSNPASGNIG